MANYWQPSARVFWITYAFLRGVSYSSSFSGSPKRGSLGQLGHVWLSRVATLRTLLRSAILGIVTKMNINIVTIYTCLFHIN
jgi:hypothetical protein